jgi:hypothetical protein
LRRHLPWRCLSGSISRGRHVVDHDAGAFLGETLRHCLTNAMPGASHQHHHPRKTALLHIESILLEPAMTAADETP